MNTQNKNIVIKAEDLTKVYALPAENIIAVNRLSLQVKRGEFVALMGPSGSGKTTLLDVLGCLDRITSGRLTVFGEDVTNASEARLADVRRGKISFVFQEFLLIPELTAIENVELPALFARMSFSRDKALELLKRVGLGDRGNHLPRELSGGEKQRVAIARSLMTSPSLLLADEPTGNLDSKNSSDIFSLFKELNSKYDQTIIVTTHNVELGSMAGRIIHLRDGCMMTEG